MSRSRQNEEEAIEHALEDIQNGRHPNAAKAAVAYGLKSRTLQRRVSGGLSLFNRPATNRALDPAQEQVLSEYIQRLDSIGKSPTNGMLRSSANQILRRSGQERVVGPDWVTRFRKRKRDSLPNHVASKSGVVTVAMVRAKKPKWDDDAVVKAQRDVEMANTRPEPEQIKAHREFMKPWKLVFRDIKKALTARNKRLREGRLNKYIDPRIIHEAFVDSTSI